MAISVQDAIDHLHNVAVVQGSATSPDRLRVLADYCVQELELRGIRGAETEQELPGAGRPKKWDVAWCYDEKFRLGISLKSMLKNLPGTVPNRIDDLMGEVANVQLHSPEIVVGYVMILDVATDQHSVKHGCTWSALLGSRLTQLSGRGTPSWAVGTIEAHVLAQTDLSKSTSLLTRLEDFDLFFDRLADQVRQRNPGMQ